MTIKRPLLTFAVNKISDRVKKLCLFNNVYLVLSKNCGQKINYYALYPAKNFLKVFFLLKKIIKF